MEVVKQRDVMKFLRPNSNFQFLFVQEKKKKANILASYAGVPDLWQFPSGTVVESQMYNQEHI